MTQFGSAGGVSYSYGNATPVIRGALPVSASGSTQSVGKALAATAFPIAAMTNFSAFDDGYTDPVYTRIISNVEGNDANGVWNRYSVTATAPTDFYAGNGSGPLLWRGATRAAPQVRFFGVPANEFHYIDAVQLELGSAPTAYEEPRKININMRADRVNLAQNPGGQLNYIGYNSNVSIAYSNSIVKYGSNSWQMTSTAPTLDCYARIGGYFFLPANTEFIWSCYVYTAKDTYLNLNAILVQEATFGPAGQRNIARAGPTSSAYSLRQGWNRISGTAVTPADWTGSSVLLARPARNSLNSLYDTTIPLYYSAVLVETNTSVAGSYFDGSFPSIDYLWENGAFDTANGSRSHQYVGFRAKQYRINDLVGAHVPHGLPYSINYATAPRF